jgi:AcrR family transcriptional regulator
VYRRFATKDSLLRAVLERRFADVVDNAIQRAQFESDARESMRIALEGAMRFIVDDPNTIDAAANSGVMTMDMADQLFEPVGNLLRRGQDADVFRKDLVAEDIPRIVLMLAGTLVSFDRGSDGWCRYVELVLDMMCETHTGLTAASAVRAHGPPGLVGPAT